MFVRYLVGELYDHQPQSPYLPYLPISNIYKTGEKSCKVTSHKIKPLKLASGEYWRLERFVNLFPNKYWFFFYFHKVASSQKTSIDFKNRKIFDWLLGISLKVPHFNICFPFRSFLLEIDVWQENWKWFAVNKPFLALFITFKHFYQNGVKLNSYVHVSAKRTLVLHIFLKSI